jgi:hypothetical protein
MMMQRLPTLPLRPLSSVSCACIWLGRVACTGAPYTVYWDQDPDLTGEMVFGVEIIEICQVVGQGCLHRNTTQNRTIHDAIDWRKPGSGRH